MDGIATKNNQGVKSVSKSGEKYLKNGKRKVSRSEICSCNVALLRSIYCNYIN